MSRIEVVDSTVADAVEDAFEELEELRAELSDWAFNMRQSNLGQTRKCFEVEDAEAARFGPVGHTSIRSAIAGQVPAPH